ncbi:phosphotransferase [Actinomadura meridiana]
MSAVERLFLEGGSTAILKYAVAEFAAEANVLRHASVHGAPVPQLMASTVQGDGSLVMIMEDLGTEIREAGLKDAAEAAVSIHACPPLPGRPVLDADGLAALPGKALGWLDALRAEGRWLDADDIAL